MRSKCAVKNSFVPTGNEEGARLLLNIENISPKRPMAGFRAQTRALSKRKSATEGPLISSPGNLLGVMDQAFHIVFSAKTTEMGLAGEFFQQAPPTITQVLALLGWK